MSVFVLFVLILIVSYPFLLKEDLLGWRFAGMEELRLAKEKTHWLAKEKAHWLAKEEAAKEEAAGPKVEQSFFNHSDELLS